MDAGSILLVEDDPVMARLLELELQTSGYEVELARDGLTGLERALSGDFDLLLLDLELPGLDGLGVCRQLRQTSNLPILILSGHHQDHHKVIGLEVGADDYLGKPHNPRELLARVRALLRRARGVLPNRRQAGRLTIDAGSREVTRDGQLLSLTPIEFSLLSYLVERLGQALSREELLQRIWGPEFTGSSRTIDSHVRNLRRKLEGSRLRVEAVRSIGFKLVEMAESGPAEP
ncbi:MAG: response regulator transcription factor [Candidatus Eremiobacteraeota bacterium]|nr:response regulator transcription factor [Candidatus Eremiobacteraeota bacterium]